MSGVRLMVKNGDEDASMHFILRWQAFYLVGSVWKEITINYRKNGSKSNLFQAVIQNFYIRAWPSVCCGVVVIT